MKSSGIPDIRALERDTIQLLKRGITDSEEMREQIGADSRITRGGQSWRKFVNNHAWALVRLQAKGQIHKLSIRRYELITGSADFTPPIQRGQPLPRWARVLVSDATRRNAKRWKANPFYPEDLIALWQECSGRCMLTGLEFRETSVGSGKARRPYAPSLDRMNSEKPYTRGNCRLVLQAVNFALNAWGDDVFLAMAEGAIKFRDGRGSA
jgi:hypothetical protein